MNTKINTPFLNYVLVVYGYEELIGIYGAKANLKRIISELEKYNVRAILEVCTKSILLIKSWGIDDKKIQGIILRNFFPDSFTKLLSELEKRVKSENWIIFNEHSFAVLMKMAIIFCKDEGGLSINQKKEKNDFGIWYLMLNNLITEKDTNNQEKFDINEERKNLRRALAKYHFNRVNERLSFKLTRYNWIFNYLSKNYQEKLDISSLFIEATGISYESYLSVTFALIVNYVNATSKPLSIEEVNKRWLVCTENYLINTSFRKKTISQAINQLVGDINLLKKSIESEDVNEQTFFYDMKVFAKYPLIGDTKSNCFILTDPRYLYDRASEGAYWIVENYLLDSKKKDSREKHSEIWGYGFDKYIRVLLKATFKKHFMTDLYVDNEELADGLIVTSKYIFIIENKHHHWRYSAKSTGNESEMKTTLKNLFSSKEKKKGLGQISSFIQRIKSNKSLLSININNKIFVPVIVISETIPMDDYSRKLYEDQAKKSGAFISEVDVMPFIVITAEDIEMLSCIAEIDGIENAAKILADYSAKFILHTEFDYPVGSIPFKSYLHSIQQSVPDGFFLRNKFDVLSKKLEKRIFRKRNISR